MKYRSGVMTDFSIGQSLLTINRITNCVKNNNIEKIVVADDMTISSLIALQNAAKKNNFQAMVGVKYRCYDNPTYRKAPKEEAKENPFFAVKIFPRNEEGLKSIFKILSLANTEERFYYNARGSVEDLKELRHCVVTSGDFFGVNEFAQFEQIKLDKTCAFYVELCPINTPYWDTVNYKRMQFFDEYFEVVKGGVVSYPALYPTNDFADSLKPIKAVCTNTPINADYLPDQPVKNLSLEKDLSDGKDLIDMFNRIESIYGKQNHLIGSSVFACIQAEEFNKEPFYVFEHHAPCLPKMAENEFETLVAKCFEGFKTRLFEDRLGYKPDASLLPVYKERLAYELSILKKMGFAGYFLVVEDLVNWSKTHGVRVGCGRGSGGGSLVAYLLGITEVDPIRFNLIFERFINPSRLDLPDIDLDYQSSKRSQVIEYLKEKYGEDRVAGISNYGTLASASAFRDTGRVFGLSPLDMSATKLVPKDNGISASLSEAADMVPEIDKLKADYPEIWKHALRFEGVMRSLGQHAAGTVVAGEPLTNRAVVERRSEGNVVNWDKRVVEDMGLIKMDILGLSTLDVLDIAQNYIKNRHGVDVDYLKLPLNDPNVMDMFGRGETTAVFQFDSSGMQTLLRRLAKNERLNFDDVTAATALFRPGPLDSGMTEEYVQIKQGLHSPHYEHPIMRDALKDTCGVMVYQEQVMQISRDVSGFTMAEADLLRKAMGKKDPAKMAEMKEKFVSGAVATVGMHEITASNLFDKIEKFAGYGFCKSHACAYSILSYWTCWLKTYYPAEYFAAQLSIVHEDKYQNLVKDARHCGIEVLPPDVNFSGDKFAIKDDKHIVMPFSAIKGCSENTSKKIMALRAKANGKFDSMSQFATLAKQKGSGVSTSVVAKLDLVGAFADIEPDQKPANHEDRRKDQVTLMPGLIVDTIVSHRITKIDDSKKLEIASLVQEFLGCQDCNLCKQSHPLPVFTGVNCKYMIVSDCPNGDEEAMGKMFVGKSSTFIKKAFKDAGISMSSGYFTSLVKAKKTDKYLTNDQINGCSKYLDKEVATVKPGVIVCMGSSAIKHFLPNLKSPSQEVGNVFYNKDLDANIIVGLNPMQIIFTPSKMEDLEKVAKALAEVINVD